jgi:hypothetical protein
MLKLRDLNPFAPLPDVPTLAREEIAQLEREQYLEERRADHHRAQADALGQRLAKLRGRYPGAACD